MNQYLLLRDNKQTGPYTAQELSAKGLKPYDLVWLEGRSAAWRYPGEIEELKAFAPVVEEQPYDRFYNKAGTESAQQQAAETTTIEETQPVNKQVEQTSKHIYVTMPKGKAQTTNTPVAKKEEAKPVTKQNDKNENTGSTQKKAAAATYIISEEDDELNSGLLKGYNSRKKEDDEINSGFMNEYESRKAAWSKNKSGSPAVKQTEKPVEKATTYSKKEKGSSTTKTPTSQFDLKALLAGSSHYLQNNKNLTRALVAAVLILGGVVIGLVINSGHKQPDTEALESLVKEIRDKQNEKASTTSRGNPEVAQKRHERREAERYTDNENTEQASSPATTPANEPGMRHAVLKKENIVVTPPPSPQKSITVPVSNTGTQPVETTPAVMEPREKAIDKEIIEKARKNIYEQVHVEASAFKVGLLGGISDLDITVQNTSLYALDQVAVEIKYFGPEKKLVKTQTLLFNNVPPGKRRTLEAPSTRRGITIDYSITTINSKALGLAQTGF
ncbi:MULTISPECIES: DUF4339 domain-containing protein [Niastella]|uniref:DUF4339 domain-containing protein n=1 Tax=Niastella soli TaxID=2821487 RepID=A0ABS3YV32_9BACT|nr:DUF4339 domain-containing protein [Niastella soli]MBO9201786.1 DUF4339 domain-containing protein [Niastella soli]